MKILGDSEVIQSNQRSVTEGFGNISVNVIICMGSDGDK